MNYSFYDFLKEKYPQILEKENDLRKIVFNVVMLFLFYVFVTKNVENQEWGFFIHLIHINLCLNICLLLLSFFINNEKTKTFDDLNENDLKEQREVYRKGHYFLYYFVSTGGLFITKKKIINIDRFLTYLTYISYFLTIIYLSLKNEKIFQKQIKYATSLTIFKHFPEIKIKTFNEKNKNPNLTEEELIDFALMEFEKQMLKEYREERKNKISIFD